MSYYKINDIGQVYSTLGLCKGKVIDHWPSNDIKNLTVIDNWGECRPKIGMIGEFISIGTNLCLDTQVIILRINDEEFGAKYINIGLTGCEEYIPTQGN